MAFWDKMWDINKKRFKISDTPRIWFLWQEYWFDKQILEILSREKEKINN